MLLVLTRLFVCLLVCFRVGGVSPRALAIWLWVTGVGCAQHAERQPSVAAGWRPTEDGLFGVLREL